MKFILIIGLERALMNDIEFRPSCGILFKKRIVSRFVESPKATLRDMFCDYRGPEKARLPDREMILSYKGEVSTGEKRDK